MKKDENYQAYLARDLQYVGRRPDDTEEFAILPLSPQDMIKRFAVGESEMGCPWPPGIWFSRRAPWTHGQPGVGHAHSERLHRRRQQPDWRKGSRHFFSLRPLAAAHRLPLPAGSDPLPVTRNSDLPGGGPEHLPAKRCMLHGTMVQ